ncbi:HK97 gp10 family phage protein [Brevundimonas sp.]
MKTTVKTQGFAEMEAALGEFSKATARNVLKRAGLDALDRVAEAMKAKAPKDDGDLIDAIAVGSKLGKRQKRLNRSPSTIEVYAGVSHVGQGMPPQGVQQEFGNEHHGPQPFARPAWDQEKVPTLERVKDSLSGEIDKATERARRKALKAKG